MIGTYRLSQAAILTCALLLSTSAWSDSARERCEQEFAPRSGQAGKDVIWVPTQEELVLAMLKAAKVTKDDYVVDLGSGDGRIPIAAAKHFGARATGLEYNPDMVRFAQCLVRAAGVADKVQIKQADIFETDFSDATVVTMYLLSNLNLRLRPTILKMKPGTRVVSNSFKMGEWEPDQEIETGEGYTRGYLWIVPAQVNGTWRVQQQGGKESFEARIEQQFQNIQLSVPDGRFTAPDAKLRGAQIEFTLRDQAGKSVPFKGRIEGDTMQLSAQRDGKTLSYVAKRS